MCVIPLLSFYFIVIIEIRDRYVGYDVLELEITGAHPEASVIIFHVPAISTDATSFSSDISSFCIKPIFSKICLFKSSKKIHF